MSVVHGEPSLAWNQARRLPEPLTCCPHDLMPILADALEESGCDDAEVLDHCRGPGPHVRGCWVADLVLGKP